MENHYWSPIPQTGELDTLVELGMTSFIYTNNASVNSPPAATTDPVGQDQQFYNNIRGLWKTGEAITFGGSDIIQEVEIP